MEEDRIRLDGDPRHLAKAILRAAKETYRETHGRVDNTRRFRTALKEEIPRLSRQMVEAMERDVRDVYLMNALEIMALTYAKRELKA